MFTLKVTKQNGSTEQSDFATNVECTAHFEFYKALGYWGKEQETVHHDEIIIHHEEVPAITEARLESGVVVVVLIEEAIPARDEVIAAWDEVIPVDYTYSITEQAEPIADISPISPRQIRLALLASGITEASIDGVIAALESPLKEQAMIAWKHSISFQRHVPIIAAIGKLLGLNAEQLDVLWIAGKVL